MTLHLRPATPADAPILHGALLRLGDHLGTGAHIASTPHDLATHGLAPGRAFEGLIAEIDGRFAGMCLYLKIFSTWLGRPGVYIQDLYVEAEFRGLKVGERLLARVATLARAEGATHLRLAVDDDNPAAQAFYDRIGISHYPSDRIHAAYGDAFANLCDRDETGDPI
ncbi:MAG: GNAT family N-acetyltransferase [Mesorhizobium sp.]|nr:GNAT family N-acetyltransferase [Mesorhizobium sp.]